ncbi:MAG: HEAT repeat domain-containing protein [Planctomycetia bacterium]
MRGARTCTRNPACPRLRVVPCLRRPCAWLLVLLLALGLCGPALRQAAAGEEARQALEALRKGLRAEQPAQRAAALESFRVPAAALAADQQRAAARLLRGLLREEPDREVRCASLRALARVGGPEAWTGLVLAAVEEAEPACHALACAELARAPGGLVEVVQRLLREDQDPTFRADLVLRLGDRRRADVLPVLLAALDDPHPRVASAAAEALEQVTGQALGYDVRAWRAAPLQVVGAVEAPAPGSTVEQGPAPAPPARAALRGLVPSFLGLALTSKDMVFVVDLSGSLGPAGADHVRGALEQAVERLPSDAWLSVVLFADEVRTFAPRLVQATPRAKEALHLFLRSVAPGRSTDLYTALLAGLGLQRRRLEDLQAAGTPPPEAIALVLASDGRDTSARTPPEVVAERLERLDLARTVVHAVVLGGVDHPLMRALARRTGGHHVLVPAAR